MALTASVIYETAHRDRISFVVDSGATIYNGALVGVDADGYLINMDTTATTKFVGMTADGANDSVVGDGTLRMAVDCSGRIIKGIAVTGASTIASVNAPVWASDENTLTLTDTTTTEPVGIIVGFNTATSFDVLLNTPAEYEASI